jgi:hypothetical protein
MPVEDILLRRVFALQEHLLIRHMLMLVAGAVFCTAMLFVAVPRPLVVLFGAFFVAIGILIAAAYRPIAWLAFRFGRITHLNTVSWGEHGGAGARAWYFALGLMFTGIGLIYLARAALWLL